MYMAFLKDKTRPCCIIQEDESHMDIAIQKAETKLRTVSQDDKSNTDKSNT